ncbi:MAG TPA: hypothetical protein VKB10_08840 [Gaiellaceae bacterium]|nr:hypothetical protein [Gaiellaceae bacterium]
MKPVCVSRTDQWLAARLVERLERGEPVTADEAEFLWELAQEHVDDLLIALQPRRSQWTKSPL